MSRTKFLFFLPFVFCNSISCLSQISTGAEQPEVYLPLLEGKRTAVLANHTSLAAEAHLVDLMLKDDVNLVKIFSPEHGYRGNYADGAVVEGSAVTSTGIPVVSLYGNRKKPSEKDLEDIDILVFDLQDVGVRCYTYLSTLHLAMQACAENGVPLVVLDRPNPNGFYVDGPVLLPEYTSFVGMHTIPLVHGMTLGELAMMINGEGWLGEGLTCELTVVPCQNYTHLMNYQLPVPPSPNLPNMLAVYLYPSLVLFEGTVVSVGRGTEFPFQVFGHPDFSDYPFGFTPVSIPGVSDHPPQEGATCFGVDLREVPEKFLQDQAQIVLDWLIAAFESFPEEGSFFKPYFTKLAGTQLLQKQVEEGKDAFQIRYSWKNDIEEFKKVRANYLLYPDNK